MTANNKDKRKRTKKSGAFKRLEQKRLERDIEALIYAAEPLFDSPVAMALNIETMIAVPVFLREE